MSWEYILVQSARVMVLIFCVVVAVVIGWAFVIGTQVLDGPFRPANLAVFVTIRTVLFGLIGVVVGNLLNHSFVPMPS